MASLLPPRWSLLCITAPDEALVGDVLLADAYNPHADTVIAPHTFNPHADSYPPRLEPSERAQIRAVWFWRGYLRQVRSQMGYSYFSTTDERLDLMRFATNKARGGSLPSVYALAIEYRQFLKQLGQ